MTREPFGQRIEKEIRELFDELTETLPGDKGDVLEAAILAFDSLPEDVQHRLLSRRPETRQVAIQLLAAIRVKPQQGKGRRHA